MVSSKKPSRKTKRVAKKVKEPIVDDAVFNEVSILPSETPIEEPTKKVEVKTSKEPIKLQSSEETAWTLLDARPKMPYITSVEDAVAFADKYARWNRDVEGTKRN